MFITRCFGRVPQQATSILIPVSSTAPGEAQSKAINRWAPASVRKEYTRCFGQARPPARLIFIPQDFRPVVHPIRMAHNKWALESCRRKRNTLCFGTVHRPTTSTFTVFCRQTSTGRALTALRGIRSMASPETPATTTTPSSGTSPSRLRWH